MKKIFIMTLIIAFLTTQYGYTQASCSSCEQSEEMFQYAGFARPEPEEIEFMFDKLGLSEKIELINFNEAYKSKYMGAEFILVSLYDENIYLFAKKEGTLIGAVNQYDGKRNIILPQDIQPEWICELICFLVFGQSSISVVICFLLPLALIFNNEELYKVFFSSCQNGLLGVTYTFICFDRLCQ